MFYYEGLTCPVCQNPFDAKDDIVVCPQCGLPHHRSCWVSIGQCSEADKHGTDQQWTRENAHRADSTTNASTTEQVCSKCGATNPRYAEFCKQCGSDLSAEDWHSAPQTNQNYSGEYSPFVQPYDAYSSYCKHIGYARCGA